MAEHYTAATILGVNQENRGREMTKKIDAPRGAVPKKRVLGDRQLTEVNQLSNINHQATNGIIKKDDKFVPPRAVPKKTVKPKEDAPEKPPLKRQESLLKKTTEKNVTSRLPRAAERPAPSFSSKQLQIEDPDEDSKNDPQMVTEYIADIFRYLREMEDKLSVRKDFLKEHKTTPNMRSILVNWMAEVQENMKLCSETLYLAVWIVDRYLQDNRTVGRSSLQLVGTSALFVACKYEEMYVPNLEDFVYICDNAFTKKQILRTEIDVMRSLDFSLGRPASLHFLRRYSKVARARNEHHTLAKYLLELALLECEMSHVRPSVQAAAACCLAMGILDEEMDLGRVWTPTLAHYTTYAYPDFRDVVIDLAHVLFKSEKSNLQTVRKKYSASCMGKIALNGKLNGPLVRKLAMTKMKSRGG